MNMKFFYSIIVASVIAVGISSCAKKENYPIIPAITFKNIILYTPGDSLDVQINFTDGDGDIGYPAGEADIKPNCYLEYLVDSITSTGVNTGIYVPVTTSNIDSNATTWDTVAYPYNIPYITPTGSDKALNGIIQIRLYSSVWRFTSSFFSNVGKSIKFRVWIIDRAGHVSNRILTDAIIVPST
ncbi:MAG TPA: hypothetical protein VK806_13905 [Bacteroidia bacterium]|jgi:hypothetical protein|nr:hypothetical protein [Bacteroidia bacterium]